MLTDDNIPAKFLDSAWDPIHTLQNSIFLELKFWCAYFNWNKCAVNGSYFQNDVL